MSLSIFLLACTKYSISKIKCFANYRVTYLVTFCTITKWKTIIEISVNYSRCCWCLIYTTCSFVISIWINCISVCRLKPYIRQSILRFCFKYYNCIYSSYVKVYLYFRNFIFRITTSFNVVKVYYTFGCSSVSFFIPNKSLIVFTSGVNIFTNPIIFYISSACI